MLTPQNLLRSMLRTRSYTELATELGCSRSALSGIASGRREGSDALLAKLGLVRRVTYSRLPEFMRRNSQ